MKVEKHNIWGLHAKGEWICITTNGVVKRSGEAVMGRGCAREAAQRFPDLPWALGARLDHLGNIPHRFDFERLYTFPVKHVWWERADLDLIKTSARLLTKDLDTFATPRTKAPPTASTSVSTTTCPALRRPPPCATVARSAPTPPTPNWRKGYHGNY